MQYKLHSGKKPIFPEFFILVSYKQPLTCTFFIMSLFCLTEMSGPAFDEFLELIGKRVALKGFEGYRAQLDNRSKF